VAAVPALPGAEDWAFLSSGTWSLIGVELSVPVMSRDAMRAGFSNEAGVAGTTRFLKNIMGLWLLQQCRQSLMSGGNTLTYSELTALAESSPDGPLIDATDERLLNPADMINAIAALCDESAQAEPAGAGAIARCCIESLALAYRRSLRDLEALTGKHISCLYIVGGGSQNDLLNQWTADACGIDVLAGPVEAAALGNILGQLVGAGRLEDWREARALSRQSFVPVLFHPNPAARRQWDQREALVTPRWKGARK
jgi:rhamnulokinase